LTKVSAPSAHEFRLVFDDGAVAFLADPKRFLDLV